MKIEITASHTGMKGREGNVISNNKGMLKVNVAGRFVTLGVGEYKVLEKGATLEEVKTEEVRKVAERNKAIEKIKNETKVEKPKEEVSLGADEIERVINAGNGI